MMNIDKELLDANKEKHPEVYEGAYGDAVEKRLENEGYTFSKIQAVINNYLYDPTNEKYRAEFAQLQECRRRCKAEVKREFGMEV